MSPDPYGTSMDTGNPQSFNRHAYVMGDPVNRSDPTGLDPPADHRSYVFASGGIDPLVASFICKRRLIRH